MPFKKRNGEYYFEAVEIFNDISIEHAALHLALCSVCAAKADFAFDYFLDLSYILS